MRATCQRVHERLARDGLVYRYQTDDGLPPGEGAFGICSFWAVECRARAVTWKGLPKPLNDSSRAPTTLGLGEEIDPETGAALGNFPQAFTHVGLINAALTLAECGAQR